MSSSGAQTIYPIQDVDIRDEKIYEDASDVYAVYFLTYTMMYTESIVVVKRSMLSFQWEQPFRGPQNPKSGIEHFSVFMDIATVVVKWTQG